MKYLTLLLCLCLLAGCGELPENHEISFPYVIKNLDAEKNSQKLREEIENPELQKQEECSIEWDVDLSGETCGEADITFYLWCNKNIEWSLNSYDVKFEDVERVKKEMLVKAENAKECYLLNKELFYKEPEEYLHLEGYKWDNNNKEWVEKEREETQNEILSFIRSIVHDMLEQGYTLDPEAIKRGEIEFIEPKERITLSDTPEYIRPDEDEKIQEDTGIEFMPNTEVASCTGLNIEVKNSYVLEHYCDNYECDNKTEVRIEIDDQIIEMTMQEFKDRIFGNKGYLQRN